MTSNVGSQYLQGQVGQAEKTLVMELVRKSFKPELLNRISEIIVFHPLDKSHLINIVQILLKEISNRLKDKHIQLEMSEKAAMYVLEQSYEPQYGARPLRRYLDRLLVTNIAKLLISGTLIEHSTVYIETKQEHPREQCFAIDDTLVLRVEQGMVVEK